MAMRPTPTVDGEGGKWERVCGEVVNGYVGKSSGNNSERAGSAALTKLGSARASNAKER